MGHHRVADLALPLGPAGQPDRRPSTSTRTASTTTSRTRRSPSTASTTTATRQLKDIGPCETINCGRGASQQTFNLRVSKGFRLYGYGARRSDRRDLQPVQRAEPGDFTGRRFIPTTGRADCRTSCSRQSSRVTSRTPNSGSDRSGSGLRSRQLSISQLPAPDLSASDVLLRLEQRARLRHARAEGELQLQLHSACFNNSEAAFRSRAAVGRRVGENLPIRFGGLPALPALLIRNPQIQSRLVEVRRALERAREAAGWPRSRAAALHEQHAEAVQRVGVACVRFERAAVGGFGGGRGPPARDGRCRDSSSRTGSDGPRWRRVRRRRRHRRRGRRRRARGRDR